MIVLTIVGVTVAAITGVIFWRQLRVMSEQLQEMKAGGTDTHALSVNAGKLAEASKTQSEQAIAQTNKMTESLERTDRLIKQAATQSKAASASAQAAQDALKLSQEQLRLSMRPLVGISDELNAIQNAPIRFDNEGNATSAYRITITNSSGNGAAQNVFPAGWLVITEDLTKVKAEQAKMCSDNAVGKREFGFVLLPGKERLTQEAGLMVRKSQIVGPSQAGKYEAWLTGCIGYRDQFDFLYHFGFVYRLVDPRTSGAVEFEPQPNTEVRGVFVRYFTSLM